ncbi:hypothetical protein GGR50DRAFT_670917 [Xylaria sp. CBS 124048]|nr:hypothetical protein GGR50DRAFT_670917 [Xylaria sp. CBS 124048]
MTSISLSLSLSLSLCLSKIEEVIPNRRNKIVNKKDKEIIVQTMSILNQPFKSFRPMTGRLVTVEDKEFVRRSTGTHSDCW